MKTYDAKDIRNVLLVGHGGSGKTTLLEAMLFTAGTITRMGTVEDGNTVSDHDPDEQRKGISVSLAMAPVEWNGVKINVLDAPGYADFIGDVARRSARSTPSSSWSPRSTASRSRPKPRGSSRSRKACRARSS